MFGTKRNNDTCYNMDGPLKKGSKINQSQKTPSYENSFIGNVKNREIYTGKYLMKD